MHVRVRIALALLVSALATACMDAVEPSRVRPPWDVIDTEVTTNRESVRPTLDTAIIGYTFYNRSSAVVSLSREDGCPRFAAAALIGNAVYLLTPVCGLDGFSGDSVEQTWTVPANGIARIEVPFTGTATIGRPTPCALAGTPDLVAFSVDGPEIAIIPSMTDVTVPAGTSVVVAPSESLPACPGG